MCSTELTATVIKETIPKMQTEWEKALPSHIPAERYARVAQTALISSRDIQSCTPQSVWAALTQCAQDGLMPDNREAALVKFQPRNGPAVCQYIPMIGGILKRMRQSGEVKEINVQVVHENDYFAYQQGDEPRIEHGPALGKSRGQMIAAYAIVRMKDGGIYREVMDRSEIEKVQAVSRARNGPWSSWTSEMWRKTVMRRLSKWLPVSTELRDFLERDDHLYDLSKSPERRSKIEERFLPPKTDDAGDDVIEGDFEVQGDTAGDQEKAVAHDQAEFAKRVAEAQSAYSVEDAVAWLKERATFDSLTKDQVANANGIAEEKLARLAGFADPGDASEAAAMLDECETERQVDVVNRRIRKSGFWKKASKDDREAITRDYEARKQAVADNSEDEREGDAEGDDEAEAPFPGDLSQKEFERQRAEAGEV